MGRLEKTSLRGLWPDDKERLLLYLGKVGLVDDWLAFHAIINNGRKQNDNNAPFSWCLQTDSFYLRARFQEIGGLGISSLIMLAFVGLVTVQIFFTGVCKVGVNMAQIIGILIDISPWRNCRFFFAISSKNISLIVPFNLQYDFNEAIMNQSGPQAPRILRTKSYENHPQYRILIRFLLAGRADTKVSLQHRTVALSIDGTKLMVFSLAKSIDGTFFSSIGRIFGLEYTLNLRRREVSICCSVLSALGVVLLVCSESILSLTWMPLVLLARCMLDLIIMSLKK